MATTNTNTTSHGLRVLALHGDGLQGLGTINIIDELCSRIAVKNTLSHCPAPVDLFDVICGTGVGAFIAILLGKYKVDISTCKQHYMDLAEFIEERNLSRRAPPATLLEEDVKDFLEMLLEAEALSDDEDSATSSRRPRCQHVLLSQRRKHAGKPTVTVFSTLARPEASAEKISPAAQRKPLCVASPVAAAVAHPVNDWTSLSDTKTQRFEPRVPFIHNVALVVMQELLSNIDPKANVNFLAVAGPARIELAQSPDSTKDPKTPVQWVFNKASPIKSAFMWPLTATLKTFHTHENVTSEQGDAQAENHPVEKRRQKSVPFIPWSVQNLASALEHDKSPDKDTLRMEAARGHIRMLFEAKAEKRLYNFCTTTGKINHDSNDMIDLKETRSNIKEIIAFMDGSGLLEDATNAYGSM